jgi:hypothetical protein
MTMSSAYQAGGAAFSRHKITALFIKENGAPASLLEPLFHGYYLSD